jgi:plasmid stability protein
MTEIRIRNVDPSIVEVLRQLARQSNRSMESEIKDALARIANERKHELLARLRESRLEQRRTHGAETDSTPGIRAERDSRW